MLVAPGAFLAGNLLAVIQTDCIVITKNIWYDISRGDIMETLTIIIILIANTVISFFIAGWVCSLHVRQIIEYYYTDKKQNEKRLLIMERLIRSKML